MMPAASNKIETKPSPEALDPTKQFITLLDKKVRNIEKRKSKLDTVKAKQQAGDTLENEQKEALTHYGEVVNNLEFAREMQKNFNTLSADIEKQAKKQAKRDKMEKAASDLKRVVDILQIQTTLDSMGSDKVREHFKTGKYGAVVLTEDNLTSLDELYQLISPSRDGEGEFCSILSTSGEHLVSLVEARDREVANSTYKDLMELITLINGCGYFEQAKEAEEAEEAEAVEEEAAEEEVPEEEEAAPVDPAADAFPAPDAFPDAPETDMQNNATVAPSEPELDDPALSHSQVMPASVPVPEPVPSSSFFSAQPPAPAPIVPAPAPTHFQPPPSQPAPPPSPPKVRPLPEIMSSVRGTFSFLQDSEIELDSPHMDPAVVAAQPMMRAPAPAAALPAGFPAPPMVDSTPLEADTADALSLSTQSLPPPQASPLDFSSSSQTFAQAGLSHSQPAPSAPLPPPQHTAPPPHSLLGQARPDPGPPPPTFDLPPSIPMPPSQAQQDPAALGQQEKKFQLNAAATEFQSRTALYGGMVGGGPAGPPQHLPPSPPSAPTNGQPDRSPLPPPGPAPPPPQQQDFNNGFNNQGAGDFNQTNNYQNSFGRGGRGGGSNGYRGGQRGGRGGNQGQGNMQNGFNPRQQNGNSRPNNRGGAPFQGFQPRGDYRGGDQGGYQAYSSNGFGQPQVPFQKRGGGNNQGFPRGGGNRGAGGMRSGGGPPRQGPPRGAGNPRGGMGRPANQ